MKRYIEIIFDDSGSMENPHKNGKPKHVVAKELFTKSVLPSIGEPHDDVVLRLLRDTACEPVKYGSTAQKIGPSRINIENAINGINRFNKWTPLYLTVKDAIQNCIDLKARHADYDDYLIFVLTDGGDTCYSDIRHVISEQELKDWKITIPNLEPVLVQFDVDSETSRKNLTGAFYYLGGRSVYVKDSTNLSVGLVKQAIGRSGFDGNGMPHCIDLTAARRQYTWAELEKEGIFYHQAHYISQYKLINFEPKTAQKLEFEQYYELKFIHALVFVSQIPVVVVRSMVSQLEIPYLYNHDCIRWDFSKAKWVEIRKPHFVSFEKDETVRNADRSSSELISRNTSEMINYDESESIQYDIDETYQVHQTEKNTFEIRKFRSDLDRFKKTRSKILRPGNIVKFNE